MSSHRTLVTGFLAFEGFPVNPSAVLAESCKRRFELIDVSYAAVDAFLDRLVLDSFDRWLMMGVAARSSRMRTERFARNVIGEQSDVRGNVATGEIEPGGASQLAGTLWALPTFAIETSARRPSDDAGNYLCNYLYYRGLSKCNGTRKRIGFLHVPPFDRMSVEQQANELDEILRQVEQ